MRHCGILLTMVLRRFHLILVVVAVLLAGCGSDGGGDSTGTRDSQDRPGSTASGPVPTSGTSMPFTPPEAEFVDADVRVRFVNVFSDAGTDSNIEFGWGGYAGRESAATLGMGEVSEPLPGRLIKDALLSSEVEPGKIDLEVSASRAGGSEGEQPLMTDDETVAKGQELVWVLGSDEDPMNEGATLPMSRWIFVDGGTDDVPEPPAGKANLFLIDNGLGHIPDSFVTMGAPGTCLNFSNDIGGGNAGNAYQVDPGSMEIGIYDANGGCAEPTGELVQLDAKAGHRYLVVAYGHTKQTRTALIVDLDE